MAALSNATIRSLLQPYLGAEGSEALYSQLAVYLDLILKWNARTNLTAIREPEEIVQRHFGESVFAGRQMSDCRSLLDFGSGGGFPGIPMQLLRPHLVVTLAESQNKKAAFLREVVRTLDLNAEVWGDRVESMPGERRFDTVTLRAVDRMEVALPEAIAHIAPGGELVLLTTETSAPKGSRTVKMPNSATGVVALRTFHVEQAMQPEP